MNQCQRVAAFLEAQVDNLDGLRDLVIIAPEASAYVFDSTLFLDAFRTKLRSLLPTGSVDFDRQVLLASYDSPTQAHDGEHAYGLDVFSSLCAPITLWEECVESSGLNPFLALLQFFSLVLDQIAERCREAVRLKAKASASRIALALRQRLRSGLKFKPLHSPLQMFPRSIRPIELSA